MDNFLFYLENLEGNFKIHFLWQLWQDTSIIFSSAEIQLARMFKTISSFSLLNWWVEQQLDLSISS